MLDDLGELIVYHRKRAGLSQVRLANLAGVGKTAIFDIEHGKRTIKLVTLIRVLEVLNITLKPHGPLIHEYQAGHQGER